MDTPEDSIRAQRTGHQWIARVEAYCLHRANFYPARFDQNRRDWLDAAYLVRDAEFRALPENCGPHVVLPPLQPVRIVSDRERDLAQLPVKNLVAMLMGLDSELTDKRILSHFTKVKLAQMVCEREQRAAADVCEERTA